MVWRRYGWVGESAQFWSTLGFISSVFLGLISCRQVLRLVPDIWSRLPQSKSSTLPATLPPSQHYPIRRASLPGSRSTNFTASFLPSTTGSGRSGHTPLWLNPRQVHTHVNSHGPRGLKSPNTTKIIPKTHRVLRPETAGSRHSPLHMREAKY